MLMIKHHVTTFVDNQASCDDSHDNYTDGANMYDAHRETFHVDQMHRARKYGFYTEPHVSPGLSSAWHWGTEKSCDAKVDDTKTSLALEPHVSPSRSLAWLAPRLWRSKNLPEVQVHDNKISVIHAEPYVTKNNKRKKCPATE